MTLEKARQSAAEYAYEPIERGSPQYEHQDSAVAADNTDGAAAKEDEEDEEYGPTLPVPGLTRQAAHSGPTIPNMQDLELKRGKCFRVKWPWPPENLGIDGLTT